jgi:DNA repair ATPase RecN
MTYRTLCSVLEEMRKAYKTYNFSYLPGLIEEAQHLGNRMEAALEEGHQVEYYHEKAKEAEEEYKKVAQRLKELQKQLPKDEQPEKKDYMDY